MPPSIFDERPEAYDAWFERHPALFESELRLVKALFPARGRGLEVGTGTGRFAAALGLALGLEPSEAMARYAQARGVLVVRGAAEALPLLDAAFERVLILVTLCFVEDPKRALSEAWRVLSPGGALGVGIVDRNSSWGQHYLAQQTTHPFYREARFLSAQQVEG